MTPSLIPLQLLNVSVYDTLQPASTGDPQRIGHHDKIEIYGGVPDWEDKLSSEIKEQKGRMLISGKTVPCPGTMWLTTGSICPP